MVMMGRNEYLEHHGILGQKWGIRRFQNEDRTWTEAGKERYGNGSTIDSKKVNKITSKGVRPSELTEAHIIPKGTAIYRTVTDPNESLDGSKYISYLDSDRNLYKGGWVRMTQRANKAYENKYELTEDIKVPSRDELKSVINDIVGKNRDLQKKTVDAFLDVTLPKNSWERYEASVDQMTGEVSDKVWKKYCDDSLKAFKGMTPDEAYFYTAQTLGKNKEVKEQVIKELTKRGYNAMTDEASVGGQNGWKKEGSDPLILFDGNILQKTGSKQISSREELSSRRKYNKWQTNANKDSGAWSGI